MIAAILEVIHIQTWARAGISALRRHWDFEIHRILRQDNQEQDSIELGTAEILFISIVWREQQGADGKNKKHSQSKKCWYHHDGIKIFCHSFSEDQRKDRRQKWSKDNKAVEKIQARKQGMDWRDCLGRGRDLAHTAEMYTSEKNWLRLGEVLQCPEVLTLATFVATPTSQYCCDFPQSPGRTEAVCTWQYETHLFRNYAHLLDFLSFGANLRVHVSENTNSNLQLFLWLWPEIRCL